MITLAVLAGYCLVAVQTETGPAMGIEIDLASPASIVWPCEIDYVGDQGEKGLRIPPNIGRGWRDEAGGSATYHFFIPNDDQYTIWIYSNWHDECTNAVYARIDDLSKTIIGNDPVYHQWHWVRGFSVRLKKGTHTLILANHSDHVEFRKAVLLNLKSIGPEDSQVTFSDLFYDGFDGCDEGNFSSWQIAKGHWQVMDPKLQACMAQNALKGVSEQEAMIVLSGDSWSNYSLDLEIKTEQFEPPGAELGICFGVQDTENYYMLSLTPQEKTNKAKAAVTRYTSGDSVLIQSFEIPWPVQEWRRLHIKPGSQGLEFQLDDNSLLTSQLSHNTPVTGGIGLYLKGNTIAYFDNIHVRRIEHVEEGIIHE
jgi:hypothetical protein